jgi:hypothetical protein
MPLVLSSGERALLDAARRSIRAIASVAPADAPAFISEITVVVKTFERPACVAQCVVSIRRFYPGIAVIVCDDGRETLFGNDEEPIPGVRWITVPFESGHTIGGGRNVLLRAVTTPFFFLADDDHVFTPGTRLDVFYGVMRRHRLDIAGGAQGKGDCTIAVFEERGDVVLQRFHVYHQELEPGVVLCDRIANSFLGRTARVNSVGWEDRIYGGEHSEFFLRTSRQGFRTAFVGYVYVDHDRSRETATGILGRILGPLLPHRDRVYAWLTRGGDQPGEDAKALARRFVLEKNGIRALTHIPNRHLGRRLRKQLAEPFFDKPPVDPSA